MPFNEALFWVGLTVAGTGGYFLVAGERRLLAGVLTVLGSVAVGYSVYVHDNPTAIRPHPQTWVVLLGATWLLIGWVWLDRVKATRLSFDPNALHITTRRIHLVRLQASPMFVDRTATLELQVLNATGRTIRITSVDGRVHCHGDAGLTNAVLESPVEIPGDDSTRVVLIEQVFSPAVADKLVEALATDGYCVPFDCSSMSLTGEVDRMPITIPLARATCQVKGPFILDSNDPANMWPLPYTLVSQERYELWSGNRKQ